MKSFKTILLLLFVGIHFCKAHEIPVLLSPTMFEKSKQSIILTDMDGWQFKEGNDTSWAKKVIDTTGWKIFKPTELSAKMADKNGKVEGWFRIKIKPDAAFGNMLLGIKMGTCAAADLYVDGNFIAAFGNTGQNGKPYKENQVFINFPVPVNLKTGYEYTIAIHFVDHLSPYSPISLKSELIGLSGLIKITGPKYDVDLLYYSMEISVYWTIWLTLNIVLGLLFWLLSFQNPTEKNFRLIALFCTCLALTLFFLFSSLNSRIITYDRLFLYSSAFGIFSSLHLQWFPSSLLIFLRENYPGD
jgi:two-component system NtrC family sensor kinase